MENEVKSSSRNLRPTEVITSAEFQGAADGQHICAGVSALAWRELVRRHTHTLHTQREALDINLPITVLREALNLTSVRT